MHLRPAPARRGPASGHGAVRSTADLTDYVSLLAFLSIASSAIASKVQVNNVTTMHVSCVRGVW